MLFAVSGGILVFGAARALNIAMTALALILLFTNFAADLPSQESMLRNPSFELTAPERPGEPDAWSVFTESGDVGSSRLYFDAAHHGSQSMCLAFDWEKDKFFGITQEVAVTPGQKLVLSAYLKNLTLKGGAHVKLGLEWRNKEKKEVGRFQTNKIAAKDLSEKDWKRFELKATAPPASDRVNVTITVYIEDTTDGAFLIDTLSFESAKP